MDGPDVPGEARTAQKSKQPNGHNAAEHSAPDPATGLLKIRTGGKFCEHDALACVAVAWVWIRLAVTA